MLKSKQKLMVQNIVILTPREQIKKAILEKYTSLDEFAECIGLYPNSLKQYLRRKKLGSNIFKIKLTKALGMGYDEIVKSEKEQILEYVDQIVSNIDYYHKKEGVEVLKKLKAMCFEREMFEEYAVMLKEIGIAYYLKNKLDKAEENIKLAINYLRHKGNKNYLFYMSQLLFIYYEENDFIKMKKVLCEIEHILISHNHIKWDKMHAVYFHMAAAYGKMHKNDLCIEYNMKSIECARNKKDIGIPNISIAISYVLEEKYDLALQYYNKALEFFCENDLYYINIVYSNIAYMYKRMKKYDKACFYIDKVFNNNSTEALSTVNNFLENFIIIKIESGKKDEIIVKLKEIMENEKFNSICAHRFIDKIGLIIDMEKYDKRFLESLKQALICIIKKDKINNIEIMEKLKKYVGEIIMLQMEI